MSEIRTNILISGESSEYRSNIEISIVTLNSALVDTHSSFRTNLDITTKLKDGSISAIKTNLELNNVALKFNLVDITNNILTDLERVKLNLQEHIKDNKKHFTEKEKEFLLNLMENPNSFGSGDSLFEKVSINQNNIILPAVKPLKQDGKDAGIISNTFISCKGVDITTGSSNGGITRQDLFYILKGEPQDSSEYINSKYLRLDDILDDYAKASDLQILLNIIGVDTNGDVYIKKNGETARNFYTYGAISFGGIGTGGGDIGGVTALSALSDVALGTLTDGQALVWDSSSLKWVNKSVAASGEYLPLSGGTINGSLQINPLSTSDFYSLYIDSNNAACSLIKLRSKNTDRADIGWHTTLGVYINNNIANKSIGIKDDGTPFYDSYTLIHSGNIGSYNAGSATKLANSKKLWGNSFNGENDINGNVYLNSGGEGIYIDKSGIYWHDGSNEWTKNLLTFFSSGNVRLGDGEDDGTYKLQINGGFIASSGYVSSTSVNPFTINSSNSEQTYIWVKNTNNSKAAFGWRDGYGVFLYNATKNSFLSIDDDNIPRFSYSNNKYTLIHSGNIGSQSVNYANGSNYTYQLRYSSVENLTHTGLQYWFDWGENSITGYGGAYKYGLHIGSPESNYYFQVGMSTAYNGLYGRFKNAGTWDSWREIAFTDSNVASATKLQTARSIWGQSFDGTKSIGDTGNSEWIYLNSGGEGIYIHSNGISWHNSIHSWVFSNLEFTNGLTKINPYSGNVLIGTSSDFGSKVSIADSMTISKNLTSADWSALTLRHYGPWSQYMNYLACVTVTDGNGVVGKFGVTFNGVGKFVIRGLYKDGYDESGDVFSVDANGNMTITGSLVASGAITFGSDARYKHKLDDANISLEDIANAPLFNYRWTDRDDKKVHLGTTAQYWNGTAFKNAVCPTNDEKLWTMSYSEIAMGNTIVIARELIPIKSDVQILKERVDKLENILRSNNIKFD